MHGRRLPGPSGFTRLSCSSDFRSLASASKPPRTRSSGFFGFQASGFAGFRTSKFAASELGPQPVEAKENS